MLHHGDICTLRQKYPYASVMIGDPILERAADFEDDGHERTIAAKVQSTINDVMSDTARKLSRRTSLSGRDFIVLEEAALDLMNYLAENPVTAALLIRTMNGGGYLPDHTGAVFYLAMVLGSTIQTYIAEDRMRRSCCKDLSAQTAMDLRPLGLGAMFMDLGMYALTNLYGEPDEELTPAVRKQIIEHPLTGADMLPQSFPAAARMIVRTHHENLDGTGYPAKLPADKLHIFAKIIRICDYYAAATAPSPEHLACSSACALWQLQHGPWRHCYDPLLARMFSRLIQPFPIGAKLKLSDGRYGVLVRYNRQEVFRPTIIIAFDERGERIPHEQIEPPFCLTDAPHLQIAGFAGEDLKYLYGPDDDRPVREVGAFTSVHESMMP